MLDINEYIYGKLLEITSEYFPGKTTSEVIECALVETFLDLQMFENNPKLTAKRYADSMLHRKNQFIKEIVNGTIVIVKTNCGFAIVF